MRPRRPSWRRRGLLHETCSEYCQHRKCCGDGLRGVKDDFWTAASVALVCIVVNLVRLPQPPSATLEHTCQMAPPPLHARPSPLSRIVRLRQPHPPHALPHSYSFVPPTGASHPTPYFALPLVIPCRSNKLFGPPFPTIILLPPRPPRRQTTIVGCLFEGTFSPRHSQQLTISPSESLHHQQHSLLQTLSSPSPSSPPRWSLTCTLAASSCAA